MRRRRRDSEAVFERGDQSEVTERVPRIRVGATHLGAYFMRMEAEDLGNQGPERLLHPQASCRATQSHSRGPPAERSFCKIKVSAPLTIGSNTHIATGCFITAGPGTLEIGPDCLIGPNCVITTSEYRYSRLDVPLG